jgi:hypothetical protein
VATTGIAIERVYEASQRFKDRVLFVHAEHLTARPEYTMARVWDFLGEDYPEHDFNNVDQYTEEHEQGWPYGDHKIRPVVEPLVPYWEELLGASLCSKLAMKFNWLQEL